MKKYRAGLNQPVPRPRWSIAGWILAVVFGLGILPWPFLSMGALFIFDSPIESRIDEIQRYTFLLLTVFYPVLYGAGFLLYWQLRRRSVGEGTALFSWLIPALTPAYYVFFFLST